MQLTQRAWGLNSSTPSSPQSLLYRKIQLKMSIYQGPPSMFLFKQTHQTPQANIPRRISSGHEQAAAGRVKRSAVNAVCHHFGHLSLCNLHLLKSRAVPSWIKRCGLHFTQQRNRNNIVNMPTGEFTHIFQGWNIQKIKTENPTFLGQALSFGLLLNPMIKRCRFRSVKYHPMTI